MNDAFKEYDIGSYQIEYIKSSNLSLKINEHNTTLVGSVIDSNNGSVNNLEIVLYKLEANHELREVDRVKTTASGSYKFNNVLIGTYIIKDYEFNPEILNFNQVLLGSSQSGNFLIRSCYNLANGYLQNGAILNYTRDKVCFVGGIYNAYVSIYVCTAKEGQYEIEIDYIFGRKIFYLDINGKSTGKSYITPAAYYGKYKFTVNLSLGQNLLRFYGDNTRLGPSLGIFTLTLIEKAQNVYNLVNGILENGAVVDYKREFVINLGGTNKGSAKITVTVEKIGEYLIDIRFKHGNRPFLVSINGVNTGETYTPQADFTGRLSFKVSISKLVNEIKFYGINNNRAPNLGEFQLTFIEPIKKPLPPPTPIPIVPTPVVPKKDYSVAKGVIEKQAVLAPSNKYVLYLGGYNEGSSTVTVTVESSGTYKITLDYMNGNKPFKMDVNGRYTGELYRTQIAPNGKFITTINLNLGNNTIKFYGIYSEHAPFLGSFTLELSANLPPPPPPQPIIPQPRSLQPSVVNGVLANGAIVSSDGRFVLYLGGSRNGSSTVTVTVQKSGRYNISVDFENGYRPLKLDVNGRYTGSDYRTPTGHSGTFTTIIDLRAGVNTIKFYGVSSEYASNLGKFKLDFVLIPVSPVLPAGTYDAARGVFENGADLDVSTNFVNNLGGVNDGATRLTVNVVDAGTYILEVKYLAGEPDRNLSLDVNGRNSGIYSSPVTRGWSLRDVGTLSCQAVFNRGDNQVRFHGDGINPAPMIGTFTVKAVNNPPKLPDYTFATLNTLSYTDLISVIKSIGWYDVPGLFDFSADSYRFYNDDNRVQAIINALEQSGRSFTSQDEQGIDTLVEFLRGGFYIAFYHSQLSRLYDISYRNKCIPAIKATINNPNFRLGTRVQDKVVNAIGKLIGNASADAEVINKFSNVLLQYKTNIVNYSMEFDKNSAIYKIARETNHFLDKEISTNGDDPQRTNFYGRINSFITQVEALAEEGYRADSEAEWLVNNFIGIIGDLSRFRTDKRITQSVLTRCLSLYSPTSSSYLQILSEIKNRFNSQLSDGTTINYNQKLDEAKNTNLPNTHTFDNGEITIKTGNLVSRDKVIKLYWAAKEVKAQFVRVIGNDVALDVGNPDDYLKIIIYNSPSHYKINYQLYGHSTDNGGVYQENEGTFFTFDREAPRDSIYSLDELFRHEFTHYLQGRFLMKGFGLLGFSRRAIWFVEGSAEFFAGSTRKQGIKARESIVRYLFNSTRNKLSLSDLINSSYGSFNFYKYGFAFVYCMYSKNLGQLLTIVNYFKNNNPTGYENYLQTLRNDSNTNLAYEQTMIELIRNLGSLTPTFTSDDYLTKHHYMTLNQISSDISSVFYMTNIRAETRGSDYFETVLIRGNYNNGPSVDEVSDWNSINIKLNTALDRLEAMSWSGYKTFTAYFTKYSVDRYRNAYFEVVFFGVSRVF